MRCAWHPAAAARAGRRAGARRCAIAAEAVITKFGHGPARLRSGTLASSGPADRLLAGWLRHYRRPSGRAAEWFGIQINSRGSWYAASTVESSPT
ncbi:hypothetical protein WK41_31505 [Burkholderia cepacia]|nr:hypothetical protein WK41_31505 [Burkholderia cepacia]